MVNRSVSALGLASFKLYDKYLCMYIDKGEVRSLLLCSSRLLSAASLVLSDLRPGT